MLIPQGQRAVSRGRTLKKINILPNIGRSSRELQPHLWLTRDTLLFTHKYPRPTQRAKPRELSRNDSANISAVVCERAGSRPSATAEYRIGIDLPVSNRVSEDCQHSGEINMKCACVFPFQINLSIIQWSCPFPPRSQSDCSVYQDDFSPSLRFAFLPS